jgi:predicted MPP superfamily phosphohydrolase
MKRRKKIILSVLGGLLLVGLSLFVWSFVIEPDRLVVNEASIQIPGWPKSFERLRVIAISDLHAGAPHMKGDKLRQVVSAVNQQNPDLVVLLGDFVIQDVVGGEFMEPEAIAGELKPLRARLGVYAVLGNHDWWLDGERVRRALDAVGIKVLENDVAEIKQEGDSLWLVGLADLWTRKPDIEGTLQKVTNDGAVIVLTHNPDIFPQIPSRVSLTLAGHTHGGQVNIPLIGRPVVPSKFKQRYAAGHVQEGTRHLFVTQGIGTSIIPVRFRVPPEISIIELKGGS